MPLAPEMTFKTRHITAAKEVDVGSGRRAIIIFVSVLQL